MGSGAWSQFVTFQLMPLKWTTGANWAKREDSRCFWVGKKKEKKKEGKKDIQEFGKLRKIVFAEKKLRFF